MNKQAFISLRFLRPVLVLLFALNYSFAALAGDSWQLKKEVDGIKVYTKNIEGSNIKAIRITLDAAGTLPQLKKILLNVSSQKDWVYSTKSSSLIKTINENEIIYHTEKSMPWPLANRDIVVNMQVTEDAARRSLTMHSTPANNVMPVKKDIVRITSMDVKWNVTTIDDHTMHIEYEGLADPAGSVPAWITNMFVTKGPLETFKKLKEKLAKA